MPFVCPNLLSDLFTAKRQQTKDHFPRVSDVLLLSVAFPLQKLKEEMMAMLANVPSGVEVSKLRSQYKQLYGRPLTLAEYGLGRLKDLLLALGDSGCVERQEKKNVLRLKSLPALDQSQQGLLAKRRKRGRGGEEEERGDLQPSQTVTVTRTTGENVIVV